MGTFKDYLDKIGSSLTGATGYALPSRQAGKSAIMKDALEAERDKLFAKVAGDLSSVATSASRAAEASKALSVSAEDLAAKLGKVAPPSTYHSGGYTSPYVYGMLIMRPNAIGRITSITSADSTSPDKNAQAISTITPGTITASQITANTISAGKLNSITGKSFSHIIMDELTDIDGWSYDNPNMREEDMPKHNLSAEDKLLIEEVGRDIVRAAKDEVFEVEGAPQATIKRPDGQFRKKAIMGGWELFLTDSYLGADGKLIFCFEMADASDHEDIASIEMKAKEIEDALPLMGGKIAHLMGLQNVEDMVVVIDKLIGRAKKEASEMAKQTELLNAGNPNWGRF